MTAPDIDISQGVTTELTSQHIPVAVPGLVDGKTGDSYRPHLTLTLCSQLLSMINKKVSSSKHMWVCILPIHVHRHWARRVHTHTPLKFTQATMSDELLIGTTVVHTTL